MDLTPGESCFHRQRALMGVIRHYTKEAGVRSLEREIAAICRKVAVEVVKKDRNCAYPSRHQESAQISRSDQISLW